MAPKEKAQELVNKFIDIVYSPNNLEHIIAKDCAIIAVNEIIKNDNENYGMNGYVLEYWQEVKQEIEKF